MAELPGENVRTAAAQLSAFVPCSILEATQQAATADCSLNGDAGSDADVVMVERGHPGSGASTESLEAMPAGGCWRCCSAGPVGSAIRFPLHTPQALPCSGSWGRPVHLCWPPPPPRACAISKLAALLAPAAAGEGALLVVPCSGPALRRAAVAYLDGLVAKVGAALGSLHAPLRDLRLDAGPCSCAPACSVERVGEVRGLVALPDWQQAAVEPPLPCFRQPLLPVPENPAPGVPPLPQFDQSVDRMFAALRSGEAGAGVRGSTGGSSGAGTPPPAAAAAAAGGAGVLDVTALAAAVGEVAAAAAVTAAAQQEPAAAAAAAAGVAEAEMEAAEVEEGGASVLMSEDEGVLLAGPGEAEATVAAGGGGAAQSGGDPALKGSPEYQAGEPCGEGEGKADG